MVRSSSRGESRGLTAIATIIAILVGVMSSSIAPAYAAVISNAITSVNVVQTSSTGNGTVNVTGTWAVPNSAGAGDTFTLTLPDELAAGTLTFPLCDGACLPDGSNIVANAVQAGKVITFTLTAYADTHDNLNGSFNLQARFDRTVVTASGTYPLTFTTENNVTFNDSIDITVTAASGATPIKGQAWIGTAGDRMRILVRSQTVTSTQTVTITDNPPSVDIDCSTLTVRSGTYATGVWVGGTWITNASNVTTNCTADSVTVSVAGVPEGTAVQITFEAVAPDPNIAEFVNTANITANGTTTPASHTLESLSGGGTGTGDQAVSVGDYVWMDNDRDGIQDSSEPPVEGVRVALVVGGATVATTTTDASGFYSFKDLALNTQYTLSFTKPADTSWTLPNSSGSTDSNDSDVVDGVITFTTPTTQGTNSLTAPDVPTYDAGLYAYDLSVLKERVSVDNESHRVTYLLTPKNEGPSDALDGWSVTDVFTSSSDTSMKLVSIEGGSDYSCSVTQATCVSDRILAAGESGAPITVVLELDTTSANAFDVVHPNVAYITPASTDGVELNPLGTPPTVSDVDTDSTPTNNDSQADVTFTAPATALVSVGNFVWIDTNRDGVQDAGEPGIANVVLTLTNSDGTVNATTTTDSNGEYLFDGLPALPAGQHYIVTIEDPTGYIPTIVGSGTPATDSSTGSAESVDLTTNGASDTTLDFGFVVPMVSVGDFVWVDSNGNGVQDTDEPGLGDVTLSLTTSDGQAVTDIYGNPVTPIVTSSDGAYTFANLPVLPAGEHYVVTVTSTPAGYVPTITGVGDVWEDSSTGSAESVDLTTNGASDTTLDFGFYVPKVSVGDYLWYDHNRNGVQDEGEDPVAGVEVKLVKDGTVVATATTDAKGFYSFNNLDVATAYSLEFTKPEGYNWTIVNVAGTNGTDDSDVVNGVINFVTPDTGGENSLTTPDVPTYDGGLYAYDLSLVKALKSVDGKDGKATFTLTPKNEGPSDALAGWSVTDVFSGTDKTFTLVSIEGAGYACSVSTATCVSEAGLVAGETGSPITVIVAFNVNDGKVYDSSHPNVSYVTPAEKDGEELIPLDTPPTDSGVDTTKTDTNNDSQAVVTIERPTFNLVLTKKLATLGVVKVGDTVTYELVATNQGPATAKAGWSITEVLPEGTELVSMDGTGFVCKAVTCLSATPLAAGESASVTVKVKVVSDKVTSLRNIAFVSPADDEPFTETNPLVKPASDTDTVKSSTDNDAEAPLTITVDKNNPGKIIVDTGSPTGGTNWLIVTVGFGAILAGFFLLLRRRKVEANS